MKKRTPLALMGEALLLELQQQGRYERALRRFDVDDDCPNMPKVDPLASAQSCRAAALEVAYA